MTEFLLKSLCHTILQKTTLKSKPIHLSFGKGGGRARTKLTASETDHMCLAISFCPSIHAVFAFKTCSLLQACLPFIPDLGGDVAQSVARWICIQLAAVSVSSSPCSARDLFLRVNFVCRLSSVSEHPRVYTQAQDQVRTKKIL
ncbi:hypothetical protein V1264_023954 [Littorina saxatilis]|uniref:Uncharacterized protein n=1 Tax=Littorina saxatilis TaxID=31220 RepID=A0AAN9B9I4_9CAEN